MDGVWRAGDKAACDRILCPGERLGIRLFFAAGPEAVDAHVECHWEGGGRGIGEDVSLVGLRPLPCQHVVSGITSSI